MESQPTVLISIKKLGINGEGMGYYKKLPIFVPGALPGETAIVKIEKAHARFLEGSLVRLKEKAKSRVVPFCPIYKSCGGCSLQHLAISAQHQEKMNQVKESIEKYAKLDLTKVKFYTIDKGFKDRYYRHKAQMPLVKTKQGIITALYENGSRKPVPVKTCPVHHPVINRVNQEVIEILNTLDLDVFDPNLKQGILRTLVTRVSSYDESVQLTFVVSIFNERLKELAKLCMTIEGVQSVAISKLYEAHTHEIFGETYEILEGKETIEEDIEGLKFQLNPKAFYQLNPPVAKAMYTYALSLLENEKTAVDLYTGSGTLAMLLNQKIDKVTGVDINESSIQSAKLNANISHMDTVFLKERADKGLNYILKKQEVDLITFDPPRSGLDDKTLDAILKSQVKKLIYISCNPSTLGKNLDVLKKKYDLKSVKVFDMFPHTAQVESVCLLQKR